MKKKWNLRFVVLCLLLAGGIRCGMFGPPASCHYKDWGVCVEYADIGKAELSDMQAGCEYIGELYENNAIFIEEGCPGDNRKSTCAGVTKSEYTTLKKDGATVANLNSVDMIFYQADIVMTADVTASEYPTKDFCKQAEGEYAVE